MLRSWVTHAQSLLVTHWGDVLPPCAELCTGVQGPELRPGSPHGSIHVYFCPLCAGYQANLFSLVPYYHPLRSPACCARREL